MTGPTMPPFPAVSESDRQDNSGALTAVSLFSGVGGMDLACERAGIKVVATAEIDKHARNILARHFPAAHHYDDVKAVTRDGLLRDTGVVPRVVIGGFPCQDLSVAGLQAGLAGERSGLYYEALRVAQECRAEWVVIENVPGLLSSNGGRDMGAVLGSLADSGYGVAYRVLDAQYFGVPQRRRRVFIVGHLGDDGGASAEVLALAEGSLGHPAPSRAAGTTTAGVAAHGVALRGRDGGATAELGDDTAYALRAAGGGGSAPYVLTHDAVSTLQGGGKRGYRVDAEAAAGGHLLIQPVVTYRKSKRAQTNQDDETWVEDHKTNTINLFDTGDTRATSLIVEPLAFMWQAGGNNSASGAYEYDMTPTLPKSQTIAVQTETTVRRLTPMECERLQGFSDGWTADQADTHRYRQMGNAVAVPCVEWITRRIAALARAEVPRDRAVLDEHDQRVADVGRQVLVTDLPGDGSSRVPDLIGDADVA